MSITYVACTSCGKKVPLMLMKYRLPTAEFPDGSYEGTCRHCGAKFEYEAGYIKTLQND